MKLQEMDLDGLLADPPALALVDELAHSNVPGSRHAKRWQDIQELLAAGIDVYTTVNVQHLESLNDQVRDITGVQVRETVPDWVLQEAYEIVLIDLPPRELLERLREGKVYVPEQARAAIDAFFSQTNLTALRNWRCRPPPRGSTPTSTTATASAARKRRRCAGGCVGIDGDEQAERLVRHARLRVAERRHLPWSVVHVDTGGLPASTRGCACEGAATGRAARRRDRRAARRRGGADPPATCPRAPRQPGPGCASRGAAGTRRPSAAVSPGACCATARAWRSVPWTARPTCARRNRGHAIRWCGTTICWRCWRPPWPAAWPGSWRTCWSCRTSPWCS
ncbi:hypothetical protein P4238_21855 [Pseudomonas aeruginosa]|nr:hypothetical protein [Pseudomonas aeruginosa]